jgi:hypothetical protein
VADPVSLAVSTPAGGPALVDPRDGLMSAAGDALPAAPSGCHCPHMTVDHTTEASSLYLDLI